MQATIRCITCFAACYQRDRSGAGLKRPADSRRLRLAVPSLDKCVDVCNDRYCWCITSSESRRIDAQRFGESAVAIRYRRKIEAQQIAAALNSMWLRCACDAKHAYRCWLVARHIRCRRACRRFCMPNSVSQGKRSSSGRRYRRRLPIPRRTSRRRRQIVGERADGGEAQRVDHRVRREAVQLLDRVGHDLDAGGGPQTVRRRHRRAAGSSKQRSAASTAS